MRKKITIFDWNEALAPYFMPIISSIVFAKSSPNFHRLHATIDIPNVTAYYGMQTGSKTIEQCSVIICIVTPVYFLFKKSRNQTGSAAKQATECGKIIHP